MNFTLIKNLKQKLNYNPEAQVMTLELMEEWLAAVYVLFMNGTYTVHKQQPAYVVSPVTSGLIPSECQTNSGLHSNETNFNKRSPERGDARCDGRWPATLRSGYRSILTRAKESQHIHGYYYPG